MYYPLNANIGLKSEVSNIQGSNIGILSGESDLVTTNYSIQRISLNVFPSQGSFPKVWLHEKTER